MNVCKCVCVCVFECLRKYVCKLSDSVQKNNSNTATTTAASLTKRKCGRNSNK